MEIEGTLSVQQVAERRHVNRTKVGQWIVRGLLNATKHGRRGYRITVPDLLEFEASISTRRKALAAAERTRTGHVFRYL